MEILICPRCGQPTLQVLREVGNPDPVAVVCSNCGYQHYFGSVGDKPSK